MSATGSLHHGLKGDKEILISQISSIQFKSASFWSWGYIQFAFLGGREAKGGYFQSLIDENSVSFDRKQEPAFERLKNEIYALQETPQQDHLERIQSVSDEAEKLASLRDRGILTEEEFERQKKRTLRM